MCMDILTSGNYNQFSVQHLRHVDQVCARTDNMSIDRRKTQKISIYSQKKISVSTVLSFDSTSFDSQVKYLNAS